MQQLLFCTVLFLLASSSCAQLSPGCTQSLQGILNATIILGESAYNVSSQCPGPQCQGDVQQLSASVTGLLQAFQTVINKCAGGAPPACEKRLQYVSQDLGDVASDAVAVSQDCNGPNVNQTCSLAVQELSADIARAVTDLITAITICSTGGNNNHHAIHALVLLKKKMGSIKV